MEFPDYKMVSVDSLIPYARNSRTHSDEQVAQIAASIREFGFLSPIIIDGNNGIIAGHGRVLAAQKLKIEQLPCIEASHLTEAQRKAYVIADNKLALNAGWDDELLRIELDELKGLGFDVTLTGFDLNEIDLLTVNEGEELDSDPSIDKYTSKIEAPIYEIKGEKPPISELYDNSKTGDLYEKIKSVDLPDDVRGFLMAAASRHTVFNYEKIAEFYAHQDEYTKELMEQSALVIIDFDKAIEYGFVKLTAEIESMRQKDNE
jgi:hypothetical protein